MSNLTAFNDVALNTEEQNNKQGGTWESYSYSDSSSFSFSDSNSDSNFNSNSNSGWTHPQTDTYVNLNAGHVSYGQSYSNNHYWC